MQLSDTATSLVGFAAGVLAVLLVAGLALALRRVNRLSDEVRRLSLARPVGAGDLAALRSDLEQALRHVAVVRYDAFGDMGGRLSFSAAVVDDRGDGLVFSSIHARGESRTYAKNVAGWTSEVQLSPEETEAIANARP